MGRDEEHRPLDRDAFARRAAASARDRNADADAQLAALDILRAANIMVQGSERAIHRSAGLHWGGFSVLWALHILGPMQARDLARVTGTTKQAVSRAISVLEQRELVLRGPTQTGDRRARVVSLTAVGKALAARLTRHQETATSLWLSALSPGQRRTLVELLDLLVSTPFPRHAEDTVPESGADASG